MWEEAGNDEFKEKKEQYKISISKKIDNCGVGIILL